MAAMTSSRFRFSRLRAFSPTPLIVPRFFFNDTATTEIYTLSLHDALPISMIERDDHIPPLAELCAERARLRDRKSTRLNSSHEWISYAVFCLKKKKKKQTDSLLFKKY